MSYIRGLMLSNINGYMQDGMDWDWIESTLQENPERQETKVWQTEFWSAWSAEWQLLRRVISFLHVNLRVGELKKWKKTIARIFPQKKTELPKIWWKSRTYWWCFPLDPSLVFFLSALLLNCVERPLRSSFCVQQTKRFQSLRWTCTICFNVPVD